MTDNSVNRRPLVRHLHNFVITGTVGWQSNDHVSTTLMVIDGNMKNFVVLTRKIKSFLKGCIVYVTGNIVSNKLICEEIRAYEPTGEEIAVDDDGDEGETESE